MNLFLQYLKHRHRIFIVGIAFLAVFMISFALFQLPVLAVIYPVLLCTVASVFIIIFDFLRVKREHSILQNIRSMMDAMTEVLTDADIIKEEDYQHILHLINEEYGEYRTETNRRYSDMIYYYTTNSRGLVMSRLKQMDSEAEIYPGLTERNFIYQNRKITHTHTQSQLIISVKLQSPKVNHIY